MPQADASFTCERAGHRFAVHHADCLTGMPEKLEPGSVDVVVTSPPYNLGTAYRGYDDTIGRGDYVKWIGAWGAAVAETLREDGSLFLNFGGKPSR